LIPAYTGAVIHKRSATTVNVTDFIFFSFP
jgi:hypothetical protein